jgi:outer membrane protein assembly factor BamC
MQKNKIALGLLSTVLMYACANINTQAEYSSSTPRSSSDLTVPPGLSSPEISSNYKLSASQQTQAGYQLNQIKDMKIVQAGSERWLVINNKSVNEVWPLMLAYLNQMGLAIKYQNKTVGLIQTDWATKNNQVPQTGIRGLFNWIGWGNMYAMPSQYMFRVNLWQNESQTQIFVTDYQMNEVYPGCVPAKNSTIETSDQQQTKWMPLPPNPQLELDFLLNFMAFAGLESAEVAQAAAVAMESQAQATMAQLRGNQLIINDQFDQAWWRTSLALERAGLGVADKDRSAGIYYVYPLQSQISNPDPGFLEQWFSKESHTLQLPKAKYLVKLTLAGQQTVLTMTLASGVTDKNFAVNQQKYLAALLTQLQ